MEIILGSSMNSVAVSVIIHLGITAVVMHFGQCTLVSAAINISGSAISLFHISFLGQPVIV